MEVKTLILVQPFRIKRVIRMCINRMWNVSTRVSRKVRMRGEGSE